MTEIEYCTGSGGWKDGLLIEWTVATDKHGKIEPYALIVIENGRVMLFRYPFVRYKNIFNNTKGED